MTTIKIKNGSGAPLATDLVQGELAIDLTNKRLYTEDGAANILELGTSPSTIDINAGTIDGTVIGGASAAAGTFTTLTATSADINGGTIDGTTIGGASAGAGTFTTLTADGLTVDGIAKIDEANPRLRLVESDTTDLNTQLQNQGGVFKISTLNDAETAAIQRLTIGNATGNISFYEDTGTTPKLFWDASAESLGIGTTSPLTPLHVNGTSGEIIRITHTSDTGVIQEPALGFGNNVLLTHPAAKISSLELDASDNRASLLFYTRGVNTDSAPDERMRLDSSGNLLVGKTSQGLASVGFETGSTGATQLTRDGGAPLTANRLTSDGDIVSFRKDGTTVGSIGVNGKLTIGGTASGDSQLRFGQDSATPTIQPANNSGTITDNAVNIGQPAYRFKDLYLSGGVYVGGTASANLLDDYEEGTWTPTPENYDGTMTVNSATYEKIGRQVTVRANVTFDGTADGSSMQIDGLPFSQSIDEGATGAVSGSSAVSIVYASAAARIVGRKYDDTTASYSAIAADTIQFTYTYRN